MIYHSAFFFWIVRKLILSIYNKDCLDSDEEGMVIIGKTQRTFGMIIFACILGMSAVVAAADVTGNFGTHIAFSPQTTVSEFSALNFDVQNELNLTFAVSGLSSTLHTHFGIAGVEDVILSLDSTLGAFDFSMKLVSARFAFGSIDPFYNELHFVMQRVSAALNLGGVLISNDSQYEDTNAFISTASAYAFGNVIQINGQTISGVTLHASTGICMQQIPSSIKKHFAVSPWSVNPDCATTPKPDLLFDFERVAIVGIPVAPGVFVDSTLNCIQTSACALKSLISLSGTPIPFALSFTFSDLFNITFGGAEIILSGGAGTLTIGIAGDGSLGAAKVDIQTALNPDTNPAIFSINSTITPGVGMAEAVVDLTIQQLGMTFGTKAEWLGGPPAMFAGITFSLDIPADVLAQLRILPGPDGILQTLPAVGSDDEVSGNTIVPGRNGILETDIAPESDDFEDQASALRLGLKSSATFTASGLVLSEIFITMHF